MSIIDRALRISLLLLSCWAGLAVAQKPRIVCWTDAQGMRTCGDRVPAEYSRGENETLDAHGRVVSKRSREPTELERAQQRAQERAAAERLARAAAAAEYDQFLIQSYASSAELQAARDERLHALEGRRQAGLKLLADDEAAVEALREQAAAAPGDAAHAAQLQSYRQGLAEAQRAVAALGEEHQRVCAGFERDHARLLALRQEPPATAPPCPRPAPAIPAAPATAAPAFSP